MIRFQLENPNWPDIPWWEYYLLENFFPLAGVLLGLIVLLLVLSVAIRRPWTKRSAIIAVLLMVSLAMLSIIVQTPREKMRSTTAELVEHASPTLAVDEIERFLIEQAVVDVPSEKVLIDGRASIVDELRKQVADRYRLDQLWISALDARQLSASRGQSEMILVGKIEGGGFAVPFKVRLRFDFEKIENDWLISRVTIVLINDTEPTGRFW